MPKIENYSRDNIGFPAWEHDTTEDRIEVQAAPHFERTEREHPTEYAIVLIARDNTNSRTMPNTYTSKEKAASEARRIAREKPDGELVRTQTELQRQIEHRGAEV